MVVSDVTYVPAGGDGVAEVVIHRAATGNSLTPAVAEALADALGEVDERVRCVVLRTEGRVFCSGADLAFLESLIGATKEEIASTIYQNFQRMIRAVVECPVPVVVRLQGGAAGAGCDLALACDYVVASDRGWFEESWIRIGATSALAGAFHLTKSAGPHRALDLLVSARRLGAAEAKELGFVHVVVEDGGLDEASRAVAREISGRDPAAVRAMKRLVRNAQRVGFEDALELGLELQSTLLARPEFANEVVALGNHLRAKSNV